MLYKSNNEEVLMRFFFFAVLKMISIQMMMRALMKFYHFTIHQDKFAFMSFSSRLPASELLATIMNCDTFNYELREKREAWEYSYQTMRSSSWITIASFHGLLFLLFFSSIMRYLECCTKQIEMLMWHNATRLFKLAPILLRNASKISSAFCV